MLNVIDSLPIPYISLISTWDCYAVFETWCKKKKLENSFFTLCFIVKLVTHSQSSEHNWANISETNCSVMLVMASSPLGYCSFKNILTNPIISQTDPLLPPYIISYYSSAFTIISTTTTPKCTLRFFNMSLYDCLFYCLLKICVVRMNLPSIDCDESQTVTRLLSKNERTRAMSWI